MSLEQEVIPIKYNDNIIGYARKYGNNAAWLCECGMLLAGSTWETDFDNEVKCHHCEKSYVPKSHAKGKPVDFIQKL